MSALLLILGLISGLAPLWKRDPITIFPDFAVMEAIALIFGLVGVFGLSVAVHVRQGFASGNRLEQVFVKAFLAHNDDAWGKTGEEFWTHIRAKAR